MEVGGEGGGVGSNGVDEEATGGADSVSIVDRESVTRGSVQR